MAGWFVPGKSDAAESRSCEEVRLPNLTSSCTWVAQLLSQMLVENQATVAHYKLRISELSILKGPRLKHKICVKHWNPRLQLTMSLSVETDTNPLKRKRAGSRSEEVPRLPYCDAWRRAFSTVEGLRALLSPEGCYMSDVCGMLHRAPEKDERCRICRYLSINYSKVNNFTYDGVRTNFTRGSLSIDKTTSNKPLRNIKLKSICVLKDKRWKQLEPLFTYRLLTLKGIHMMPSFIKMSALIRVIGDPAEEFVQNFSGLDDLSGNIRNLLSICRKKHHACQAGRNPPCLPKRLVYVKGCL
jgi:hypothetical protein